MFLVFFVANMGHNSVHNFINWNSDRPIKITIHTDRVCKMHGHATFSPLFKVFFKSYLFFLFFFFVANLGHNSAHNFINWNSDQPIKITNHTDRVCKTHGHATFSPLFKVFFNPYFFLSSSYLFFCSKFGAQFCAQLYQLKFWPHKNIHFKNVCKLILIMNTPLLLH